LGAPWRAAASRRSAAPRRCRGAFARA
jgi:hypothetical protein